MTISFTGIVITAVVSLVMYPVVSAAWFFSVTEAQGSETLEEPTTKAVDLMTPSLSMVSDLAPEPDVTLVIYNDIALVAEIGALGTLADIIDIPENDTISIYIVQKGDTISTIAEAHKISVNTIYWANNLTKKSVLREGMKLTILPITGVRHTVVRGDTLSTIARKYNADAGEIVSYNGLDSERSLIIGAVIIIPAGEISAIPHLAQSVQTRITGSGAGGSVAAAAGYYNRPIPLTGDPSIRKTQGYHDRYNAIDVGAPVGTAILAMADGVVLTTKSVSAWNGGYGGLTIIQHSNGSQTLYAHQSRILVSPGETITQGQKIGEVGNTGRSTGPHLHYEIRGAKPASALY